MCDSIKWTVEWQSKREDGDTKAAEYERFGKTALIPQEPEVPDCAAHVMEWFWQIHSQRRSGMSGPEPMSWSEIESWARLSRTQPSESEIRMIVEIDRAYLSSVSELQKQRSEKAKEQAKYERLK